MTVEAALSIVGKCRSREDWLSADLRQILDALPTLVFVAEDRQCKTMFGNRATDLLLRAPSGANVSKSASGAVIPRGFEAYDSEGRVLTAEDLPVQRAARDGLDICGYEVELRFIDGGSVWLFGNACPLRDLNGEVWGAVGAFIDITARKQAEAQVSRANELFIAAMDAALDGFVIYKPIRDDQGSVIDYRFVYANPVTLTFAATTLEELAKETLLKRFPSANAAGGLMEHFARVVETGKPEEFVVHYSDATVTGAFRNKVVRVGEDIAVTFTDVTEELRAREAEERLARAKQEFFASASHDLRQPLQSLRLFIDVISGANRDPLIARAVKGASQALGSAETLVHSLLDVARIEAGAVRIQRQPVDLAQLVARLGSEYESVAEAKGLRLRVRAAAPSVTSDPQALERILRNLITNALRYTESGGVLIAVRRRGRNTVVEVWDTGLGMAPDHLESIWDEFVQLHNPSRDRDQGLGLGLAIVRKLAGMLGHRLEVKSRLGRGTVFRVLVDGEDGPRRG